VVNEKGKNCPWPRRIPGDPQALASILRTLWGDDARFQEVYWKRFEKQGYYWPATGVRDEDGYFWIWAASTTCSTFRATACPPWRWKARWWRMKPWSRPVVGFKHDVKGEGVAAFVTSARARQGTRNIKACKPCAQYDRRLGRADQVHFSDALPKPVRGNHAPPAARRGQRLSRRAT